MKIVSVWNPKGGQGKSLISINLAAAAHDIGLKPLVICFDPQGTSTLFGQGGNLPFPVVGEVPATRPDVDLLIIDHSAADWDIPKANTVIMPTKPDRSDIATYQDALARIRGTNKFIIPVVTDGNMQRKSQEMAVRAMRRVGAFEIKSSGVFGRAAEDWRSIFDPELNGAYKVRERRAEFEAILNAVLNRQAQEDDEHKRRVA